jgi:uncharacterized protein (DUF697 family)
MRGGDASEEKHIAGVLFAGVPGGAVLGCEWASAVCGGYGADGNAGRAGGIVCPMGSVAVGLVRVAGFLSVVSVGSC